MRLGIIGGAGWLGSAIARAVVAQGLVAPADLSLSYRNAKPASVPESHLTRDSQALADRSDVVILSVRPEDWPAIELNAAGKLLVSVMAGISREALVTRHGTNQVVRVLPNAAIEVGASYTPMLFAPAVSAENRMRVERIFACCGTVDDVSDEDQLDYLAALSGTGPAYPALLATALFDDAVARGLDPAVADRAVRGILVGTGRLLEANPQSSVQIVADFVAYRGLTAAGLNAMKAAGFDAAVAAGLEAAVARGKAMAR